jgi:predicted AlkP superfamily phosphohydrolase/phosphomutase
VKNRSNLASISRRTFVVRSATTAAAASTIGFPALAAPSRRAKKVIVLGVDGMDPGLTKQYMEDGLLPNCKRLAEAGSFLKLGTSDPPQSPVAWSNFISGTNPGGHGIFDFIARNEATRLPYLSTTRTTPASRKLPIGKFSIPVSGAGIELLRHGPSLWDLIRDAGFSSSAIKAPVNFPAPPNGARSLSGITTPDIHGSYGIFTFYTSSATERSRSVPGGQIEKVRLRNNSVQCIAKGPTNDFLKKRQKENVKFDVVIDPERPLARITLQDQQALLKEGEWSEWMTIKFSMLSPLVSTSGICRFYLKQVRPEFQLYLTPINIDPSDPALPICSPASLGKQLVRKLGYFYTQGMPEDTAALSEGVFDDGEYRTQAEYVLESRMKMLASELHRFREGFFYFYFSTLDLNSHTFWRCIDDQHPLYSDSLKKDHGDFLPSLYRRIDEGIGWAMEMTDDDTLLMIVSDHGFVPFRRQFNLNSWLMDKGYAHPRNPLDRFESDFFMNTDWTRTKAYGLGINSLYVNQRGRESAPDGIVNPGEDFERLCAELIHELKAIKDPQTGERVISNVFRPEEIYSGPYASEAPDLIVAYNRNYRASWDTILGGYPKDIILDNEDPWSGDHCMDSQYLAGVLLCNRKVDLADPTLIDLAPTILNQFDISIPKAMTGRVMKLS